MAQYWIKLGVKLNTKGLKGEIKKIKADPIKAKIDLDIKSAKSKLSNIKVNPIKVKLDISQAQKQINTLKSRIQSLSKIKVNIGGASGGLKRIENDLKRINTLTKQAGKVNVKVGKVDTKSAESQINRLKKQADNIKLKLETGSFNNDISRVTTNFDRLKNKSNEIKSSIKSLKAALDQINTAANNGNINGMVAGYEKYNSILKKVENQLKINKRLEDQQAASQKRSIANQKLENDKALLTARIDNWLKNNSAAAKKFGAEMQRLRAQIQSCDAQTLNHLRSQFKLLDQQAALSGKKMMTFRDRIKTQFARYSSYFSVASGFMYASMAIRSMFKQVVEIDTAMTELKKVTDETNATYNSFLTNAATRAAEIGTTIDGLVSSTADFARLGYNFSDARGLAEVANIYALVGDEIKDVDTATKNLISTFAAFKNDAGDMSNTEFAMSLVDKMNEVSNNFAISAGGIGEALQRSASSLYAANNTVDESIALITAANTVVQDPDVVGRFCRL